MNRIKNLIYQNYVDDEVNDQWAGLALTQSKRDSSFMAGDAVRLSRLQATGRSRDFGHPDIVLCGSKNGNIAYKDIGQIGCYLTSLYNGLTQIDSNPYASMSQFAQLIRDNTHGENYIDDYGSFNGDYSQVIGGLSDLIIHRLDKGVLDGPANYLTPSFASRLTQSGSKWRYAIPNEPVRLAGTKQFTIVKSYARVNGKSFTTHFMLLGDGELERLKAGCTSVWVFNPYKSANQLRSHAKFELLLYSKTEPDLLIDMYNVSSQYFGSSIRLNSCVGYFEVHGGWELIPVAAIDHLRTFRVGSYRILDPKAAGAVSSFVLSEVSDLLTLAVDLYKLSFTEGDVDKRKQAAERVVKRAVSKVAAEAITFATIELLGFTLMGVGASIGAPAVAITGYAMVRHPFAARRAAWFVTKPYSMFWTAILYNEIYNKESRRIFKNSYIRYTY